MDKEYIEREALYTYLEKRLSNYPHIISFLFPRIADIPSVDVEPVRHGHWIGMEGDVCSECYRSLTEIMDADSYFAIGFDPSDLVACPFCGAIMDGSGSNGTV